MINNTLKNWSYKKLKMYRHCPYSVKLKYIDRVPEPAIDPKYDAKRLRGIAAHDDMRDAINLGTPVAAEFSEFAEIVDSLRSLGAVAENDEFFDNTWKPHPSREGHWLQVIKDVEVVRPELVLIGDWKTGKKFGNEVDHYEQMRLYALTSWLKHPGRPEYTVELYYIDQDEVWTVSFRETQLEKALRDFDGDAQLMFNDKVFRPKPSKFTCQYCPYGPKRGNGACPVGV